MSFEVATIKPMPPDFRARYYTMQGAHQFVAKGYTVRFLVSAAYNLPPRAISGGPAWIDVERYDILASTPGDTRPNLEQQMAMVRTLLAERFNLKFHTAPKEFPVYVLTVAKSGSKLKETATPDAQPMFTSTVYPGDRIVLPARNLTMSQFASTLQRAILDRPVLDKTGLPESMTSIWSGHTTTRNLAAICRPWPPKLPVNRTSLRRFRKNSASSWNLRELL
jgi:uncharacterized protein (TIGR03435 family)